MCDSLCTVVLVSASVSVCPMCTLFLRVVLLCCCVSCMCCVSCVYCVCCVCCVQEVADEMNEGVRYAENEYKLYSIQSSFFAAQKSSIPVRVRAVLFGPVSRLLGLVLPLCDNTVLLFTCPRPLFLSSLGITPTLRHTVDCEARPLVYLRGCGE